jgi:hypothetical protein
VPANVALPPKMPLLVDQPACKATREVTVSGYIRHLRAEAAGRGGEAGRSKLKAFRNRVLAIPHRVEYLSARQTLALTQELRACLDELADDAA